MSERSRRAAPADDGTPPNRLRWFRRYPKIAWLTTAWMLAILVFSSWGIDDVRRAHSRASRDAIDHSEDFTSDAAVSDTRVRLAPQGDLDTLSAVLFHRDLSLRTREIEYEASVQQSADQSGSGSVVELPDGRLETRIGQFIDVSASRELDNAYVSAIAEARQNRVLVRVKFDRRSGALGSPGTYIGTISIVDPRVERVDVPFTVSLAYPWWQFVCVLLLVMLVPATMYLWFLRGSFSKEATLSMSSLEEWLFSRNALMSIGTGVAAAVSVWTATYFSSNAWGVSVTAATAMFGATFSAFIAAATAVTAAGAEVPATSTARGAVRTGASAAASA